MTAIFKPCKAVLPPAQQRIWPELAAAAPSGFALYGGTAIALRLGHRESIDFDFFSEKPLDRDAIRAAFPFIALSTVLQDQAPRSWRFETPASLFTMASQALASTTAGNS